MKIQVMRQATVEVETVGARIRRLRTEKGLAQSDIAGPGVCCAYVSLVERDLRTPSTKALRIIARNLGVTLTLLETGREASENEVRLMALLDAELRLRLDPSADDLEQVFRDIHRQCVEAGDTALAARARSNLGFIAAHLGRYSEAATHLERAVDSGEISPLLRPEVFLELGRVYSQLRRPGDAVALFTAALETGCSDPDDAGPRRQFTVYLAHALCDFGEPQKALELLAGAFGDCSNQNTTALRARVLRAKARAAWEGGQVATAIQDMNRAIALLEAAESEQSLARAHLLSGMMYLSDSQLVDAEHHFELAERLLPESAPSDDFAVLYAEKAKLLARKGRGEAALMLALKSLELIGDEDQIERGRALWALAEAHSALGKIDTAVRFFADAKLALRTYRSALEGLAAARIRALEEAGRL